jgi:hypothetical protein
MYYIENTFKKIKNIILIPFQIKNILKNNNIHLFILIIKTSIKTEEKSTKPIIQIENTLL